MPRNGNNGMPHDAARDYLSDRIEERQPAPAAKRWGFILTWFMRVLAIIWIMKGLSSWAVILGICPDAEVIDLAHDVRKFAIGEAALSLWAALPYVPVGTHVAVVDPGVGTERRPLAVRAARGDVLISIFLRGAADMLNMIVPHGEDAYYAARPKLAIARPDAKDKTSALDLDGFFGLHPALAPLLPVFQGGGMAAVQAASWRGFWIGGLAGRVARKNLSAMSNPEARRRLLHESHREVAPYQGETHEIPADDERQVRDRRLGHLQVEAGGDPGSRRVLEQPERGAARGRGARGHRGVDGPP